jgi:hypothetical protein
MGVEAGNQGLGNSDNRILDAGADLGPRHAALMLPRNALLVPFGQFLTPSGIDLVDTPGR